MKISAKIENENWHHSIIVATNGVDQKLSIVAKPSGQGSSVNGGELLMAALGTCFCNDLYREAAIRNITLTKVSVEASGEFDRPGEPGFIIFYSAKVEGDASDDEVNDLIAHTDKVAEIQNTLRSGVNVVLTK